MKKEIVLTFPIPNGAILNANMPINFRVKAFKIKALRDLSYGLGTDLHIPKFKKCDIKIVVFPPSARRIDPPNFYPTVKPLIDGLTDANAWDDDDWKHLTSMTFLHGGEKSGIAQVYILKLIINGDVENNE